MVHGTESSGEGLTILDTDRFALWLQEANAYEAELSKRSERIIAEVRQRRAESASGKSASDENGSQGKEPAK
jgi:hypothetical protein